MHRHHQPAHAGPCPACGQATHWRHGHLQVPAVSPRQCHQPSAGPSPGRQRPGGHRCSRAVPRDSCGGAAAAGALRVVPSCNHVHDSGPCSRCGASCTHSAWGWYRPGGTESKISFNKIKHPHPPPPPPWPRVQGFPIRVHPGAPKSLELLPGHPFTDAAAAAAGGFSHQWPAAPPCLPNCLVHLLITQRESQCALHSDAFIWGPQARRRGRRWAR